MNKIIAGILALLVSFAATAQENPRTYWTLGGSLLTFDDGFDSIKPIQVFGRLGYDFNANFGIGAELGFSLIEDEFFGIDYSVTTTFFYLKGSIPIGEDANLYAMIGPSNVELTGSLGNVSVSTDDDDTGIGFGYETSSYSIDYVTYNDNSGVEVTAINLGFVTYF